MGLRSRRKKGGWQQQHARKVKAGAGCTWSGVLGGVGVGRFFGSQWEVSCVKTRSRRWVRRMLPDPSEVPEVWRRCGKEQGGGKNASVLVLKDQTPTSAYETAHAAYLDGCSVVVNHCEMAHAGVWALCKGLRALCPHAYAQLYATPPNGQAVGAHADDRDVVVIQMNGAKTWTLWPEKPVEWPGPREQVGKSAPFPKGFFEKNDASEVVLRPGDVLYVPRGVPHECHASTAGSLHLTVALATHDWSWARLLGDPDAPLSACDFAFIRPRLLRYPSVRTRALLSAAAAGVKTIAFPIVHQAYRAQVAPHNHRQDASRPRDVRRLLYVRRLADDERARAGKKNDAHQPRRGIDARAELETAIPDAVAVVGVSPFSVRAFPDAPGFDALSKVALAQACIDLGLFVACDRRGLSRVS